MSGFDECCPHCEKRIKNLYQSFVDKDYSTAFSIECPHCFKKVAVDVHTCPEFETSNPDLMNKYIRKEYGIYD